VGLADGLSGVIAEFAPPLLLLDRNLRLCGATQAAEHLLHIGEAQLGQLLGAIEMPAWTGDLHALAHAAMTARTISERDMRDAGGRWYPCWSGHTGPRITR